MAPYVFLVFLLTIAGGSDAAWCVCKPAASSDSLQKTLDYACGAGADCIPIHQNGTCYNPNTVLAHCSYAANSYYQRNGQNQQACDFAGAAQLSPADPSQPGCLYPATPSAAGSSSTTPSATPTMTPGTPGTPTMTPATPGTPTMTPATPGTPTMTPATPGTPTMTPATPGTPTMTPATPGITPIGGGGTTFDPNTPTTTGGSSSFGMGPSSVGFDGSHAPAIFYLKPKIIFLLVLTLSMFNF